VEAAGADFLLLCTNTMHKVAAQVEAAIGIPLLHLADASARRVIQAGISTVGLLGTRFTMEEDFYSGRLADHGLDVRVPREEDRGLVHRIIYEELCLGTVQESSRNEFLRIMKQMQEEGVEGIIEGCTEIGILVQQDHTDIPLFDTTAIHAQEAVARALE
jgi:aspartate racemase